MTNSLTYAISEDTSLAIAISIALRLAPNTLSLYYEIEDYMFDYYMRSFTSEEVNRMLATNEAIQADNGGLILGRSHDEGGIMFLVKRSHLYFLEGEVEGYEYIFNIGATFDCEKFFTTLNNHAEHHLWGFKEYIPSVDIITLDTRNTLKPNI